jgi:hypothetical protein
MFCWKILTDLFCYRVLWKSKKDELKDTEDNTEVTCHLAYAIAATIVTVTNTAVKAYAIRPFIWKCVQRLCFIQTFTEVAILVIVTKFMGIFGAAITQL